MLKRIVLAAAFARRARRRRRRRSRRGHPSELQLAAASNATAGRVTLHKTKLGKVLATSSGRTLYLFMADKHGKSACYGQCATYWPPL